MIAAASALEQLQASESDAETEQDDSRSCEGECMHARIYSCMRACVCVRACVRVCMCVHACVGRHQKGEGDRHALHVSLTRYVVLIAGPHSAGKRGCQHSLHCMSGMLWAL